MINSQARYTHIEGSAGGSLDIFRMVSGIKVRIWDMPSKGDICTIQISDDDLQTLRDAIRSMPDGYAERDRQG